MFKLSSHISRGGVLRRTAFLLIVVASTTAACSTQASFGAGAAPSVQTLTFTYSSHDGVRRLAYVVLPSWYGPDNDPALPVVISPHGRNANGLSNSKYFGNLPAVGRFIVISPDGMGHKDTYKSFGYRGQIDDLARMPELAEGAFPWLNLDHERIYALGSSMGGQETALLVARHPHLLAGAAAMDSVTDLTRRYSQLLTVPCDAKCLKQWGKPYGYVLQAAMRREVGGSPTEKPRAYAARSPLSQARAIAASGVPLQIWWSTKDRIVVDQAHQSKRLFQVVRGLNPCAPVSAYEGTWKHSHEMRYTALLPIALAGFGLLPDGTMQLPQSVRYTPAADCAV